MNKNNKLWDWLFGKGKFPYCQPEDMPEVAQPLTASEELSLEAMNEAEYQELSEEDLRQNADMDNPDLNMIGDSKERIE